MKNVLFVAPTTYEVPLTENIEKKFKYLNEICNLHIFAFGVDKKEFVHQGTKLFLYKKVKNRILNYFKIFGLSATILPNIIKENKIEIISYQDPVSSFFSILVLKIRRIKVKIIIETHGDFIETLSLEKNLLFPSLYKKIFLNMARYTLDRADKLRAVSSSTEAQVKEINQNKEITRFPAWVDFDNFKDILPVRENNKDFKILFIGSVTDRKKPHLIVEAINNLNSKDVNLYVVGPTPNESYLSKLKELVNKYELEEQVVFAGSVDRESVMEYYSQSNLMILPSVSEGLARVIFESQATGCPVLVTDAPGMGDIVIDGQTGYVFESNNLESLTNKIQEIKTNYKDAIHVGKNAKDFILSNYSADNFKFSFKKLFDTV
jgi:glycosyltransferase involved in cell wall biosynthesis